MTYLERAMIRRGHPKQIIVGIVGLVWTVYFLWHHDWAWAVGVVLASAILGRIVTGGTREEDLAQTLLGKIMLLHLPPHEHDGAARRIRRSSLWYVDSRADAHSGWCLV